MATDPNVRMGVHAQHVADKAEVRDYIRRCKPGIILWCSSFDKQLMAEAKGWGCVNVGRRWFPHEGQWLAVKYDPVAAARQCAEDVYQIFRDVWGLLDYVVGYNEYWGSDKPAEADCEAAYVYEKTMWQEIRAKRIPGNEHVVLYAAYSMPPGNPSPEQWAWILARSRRDGIKFPGDAYATHAYWGKPAGPLDREAGYDPSAPYLIAREFLLGEQCPVPIIYTEVGYDRSILPGNVKKGWQEDYQFAGRDEVYASQFSDWCRLMADYGAKHRVTVIGGTFFTIGFDPEWTYDKKFDFTAIGPIADKMAAWPKYHTIYEEEPPVPPKIEWHGRFADLARERASVVGNPTGNVIYPYGPGFAVQQGENGIMFWDGRSDPNAPAIYVHGLFCRRGDAETEDIPQPFRG